MLRSILYLGFLSADTTVISQKSWFGEGITPPVVERDPRKIIYLVLKGSEFEEDLLL